MGATNNIAIFIAAMSVICWVILRFQHSHFQYMCDSNNTENCFENPNTPKYMKKVLNSLGLELETYLTKTVDEHELLLFRIPPKWNPKGVVFLHHPLLSTSIFWVDKGNDSYAYALHEAGYDVWLGNFRGTAFSSHEHLTKDDFEYWNFSFHEMGVYDTKVQVEFVANSVNRSDIVVVGYSLGTTASLVYASLLPEEAQKYVKVFVAISPSAFGMTIGRGIQTLLNWKFNTILKIFFDYLKIGAISESTWIPIVRNCRGSLGSRVCKSIVSYMCGANSDQFDLKFYSVLFSHHPATTSMKTMLHYFQTWENDGIFRQYDYGEEINMLRYNSSTQPEYPLNDITVPFYLIYGIHDDVATPKDLEVLYERLPEKVKIYGNKMIDNNHCDPFMSKNLHEVTHRHSIDFINDVLANRKKPLT